MRFRALHLALSLPVLAGMFSLLPAPAQNKPAPGLAVDFDTKNLTPRERLGLSLFFDTRLSEPAGLSCASCHDPARAFSGNNGSTLGVALGSRPATFGTRDTPTAMYLAAAPRFGSIEKEGNRVPAGGLFWDGRAETLEEQAKGPFFNPLEMNNPDAPALIAKIAGGPHAAEFRKVWGDNIFDQPAAALDAVAASIAAFERTRAFQPFSSKFDAVMRGQAKFSEQEQRGLGLFSIRQKGNCASCHTVDEASRDPAKSLFTDFSYHALGAPRSPRIPKNADASFVDLGLCERVPMSGTKSPAKDAAHCGLFKTPTLRNIALTAPYMHNGHFDSLRDVVAFYATRDTDPPKWFPGGKKFNDLPAEYHANVDVETPPYQRRLKQRPQLSDDEIDDIMAFLRTLTDGYKP
jgi:cytochrome c peroxidase